MPCRIGAGYKMFFMLHEVESTDVPLSLLLTLELCSASGEARRNQHERERRCVEETPAEPTYMLPSPTPSPRFAAGRESNARCGRRSAPKRLLCAVA